MREKTGADGVPESTWSAFKGLSAIKSLRLIVLPICPCAAY